MRTVLITTSSCARCPEAKQWAKDNYKNIEIFMADQDSEGLKLASELGIQSVPTFAIIKGSNFETYTLQEFKELKKK